jgi:hypothetical protein
MTALLASEVQRLQQINQELLIALKALLNATMYRDHPAVSDLAIRVIAKAEQEGA